MISLVDTMGRYAFFDTGLEYKFRFGVQPSEDIRTFGGLLSYEAYERSGYLTHTWTQEDKSTIEAELKALLEWLGIEPVQFETYEKNLDGTHELIHALYGLYKTDHNEEIVARYILGCCIYHQLLYTEALKVNYET
jgi:hypothetical protein